MATGFSVTNTAGSIVVSESFENYHVYASGSGGYYDSRTTLYYLNIVSDLGIVLQDNDVVLVRPAVEGSAFDGFVSGSGYGSVFSQHQIEWIVARRSPPLISSGNGVVVKTTSGACAFNSEARYVYPKASTAATFSCYGALGAMVDISFGANPPSGRKRYVPVAMLVAFGGDWNDYLWDETYGQYSGCDQRCLSLNFYRANQNLIRIGVVGTASLTGDYSNWGPYDQGSVTFNCPVFEA